METYRYDDSGNLTVEERDVDNDGEIDSTLSHSYDASGNVATTERKHVTEKGTGDEVRWTYSYDPAGNLMSEEVHYLDGELFSTTTYNYGCW